MIPTLFRIPAIDLGLFTIPAFPVGSYAVMMTLGFLSGWWFLRQGYARRGYPLRLATDLIIVAALTGLIGARLLSVLENWDILIQNPVGVLLGSGGLTWYGGLMLAVPSCIYLAWKDGLSPIRAFDATAPGLSVGYAFGRLGCHLSGDGCYGMPTSLPWGMAYPRGAVPVFEPVHPTPIYEAIIAFGVASFLGWWDKPKLQRPGTLITVFFILHGVSRLVVEFIRRNPRYWFGEGGITTIEWRDYLAGQFGLSLSQWVSVAMIVGGGLWLWRIYRGPEPASDPYLAADPDDATDDADAADAADAEEDDDDDERASDDAPDADVARV